MFKEQRFYKRATILTININYLINEYIFIFVELLNLY